MLIKQPKEVPQSPKRKVKTQKLMIVVKSIRLAQDIQRILYSHFKLKSHGGSRVFFEDKLRYHLISHREFWRRESVLKMNVPMTESWKEEILKQKEKDKDKKK